MLGRYLGEMTAFRVGAIIMPSVFVIGGVGDVLGGNLWGVPLALAGLAGLVVPAWFWYYRHPEEIPGPGGHHSSSGL